MGCNFGEFATGANDIVVPMRPLPQIEGRFNSHYLPKNYKKLIPWVSRFGSPRAVNHAPAIDVKDMLGEEVWKEYKTISSVRNPFTAMISEYFYIQDFILHPISYYLFSMLFTAIVINYCPFVLLSPIIMRIIGIVYSIFRWIDDFLFPIYWRTYLWIPDKYGISGMGEPIIFKREWISHDNDNQSQTRKRFGDWVRNLFNQYADQYSDFYHPNLQRMILDAEGKIVPLDHYIRFELIQSDFDVVCKDLNLPQTAVAWLKDGGTSRGRRKVHYSYYYDDNARDLVAKENAAIIEKFGYHFQEINPL